MFLHCFIEIIGEKIMKVAQVMKRFFLVFIVLIGINIGVSFTSDPLIRLILLVFSFIGFFGFFIWFLINVYKIHTSERKKVLHDDYIGTKYDDNLLRERLESWDDDRYELNGHKKSGRLIKMIYNLKKRIRR
jgi:hypothetical protein